jgi:acyl carrier protein
MSGEETVEEKIKTIISNSLAIDESEITGNASLADDLGADSLDAVEIVIGVEDEFGFEVDDEDAEKLKTVQDLTDYVSRRLRKEGTKNGNRTNKK